jgi:hypothetical protein
MFNENWMNELEFHKNTIPFSMNTLKFGDNEIIVPNVSSLAIKFITYSNNYKIIFGAYVEDRDFISKIAELPISSDEFETIKISVTKLNNKDFRQIIQNKFNLDMLAWSIDNTFEIQFNLENRHQDNHFDCIQIMQDVFNQITS